MLITNEEKERRSRYPEPDRLYLGRNLSTVGVAGGVVAATLTERRGRTAILLVVDHDGARSERWVETEGDAHAPLLIGNGVDRITLIWIEAMAGSWSVKARRLDASANAVGAVETLHESRRLIYQPTAACAGNVVHIAWSGIEGDAIRIYWMHNASGRWSCPVPVSDPCLNAFRPSLCVAAGRLCLAWDQYAESTYEVVLAAQTGNRLATLRKLGQVGEKWCFPQVAADSDGAVWMTWYVETDVEDDLGIVDHSGVAMIGHLVGDRFDIVQAGGCADDPRVMADMRDGMLSSVVYKGYLGHRRRPMISVGADGVPWLLWEVRPEEEKTGVCGYLVGRCRQRDGTWAKAVRLTGGAYAYAPASTFEADALPVAHLVYENEDAKILGVTRVDLSTGQPHDTDPGKWDRWRPIRIVPPIGKPPRVDRGGASYGLYWADTHVHSHFSADAEGEADELIHFARDRAGLDIVAVTDNDVYPHKPLFRAEWAIHQELCRHFTVPGRFVVLNGYEFTFHDPTLRPDFNHRIVLYPDTKQGLWRRIDPDSKDMRGLCRQLNRTGAMCYPHHCSYSLCDEEFEWNVEICSSWRVCIEESDFSMRQLQQGRRFGFIGSSDTHRLVPGLGGALTAVYAEELTSASVFEAYRRRRTVASQGCRMMIDFRVDDLFVGEEGACSEAPCIRAAVQAEAPIASLVLIRDGTTVHTLAGSDKCVEFTFEDRNVPDGLHFYLLRVRLVGDPSYAFDPSDNVLAPIAHESRYPHNLARARGIFAWASPIWVSVKGRGTSV